MRRSTTRTDPSLTASLMRTCGALLFWCAVWWFFSMLVDQAVLLPSPLSVLRVLGALILDGSYWLSIAASLLRVLLGYAVGCLLGILIAALCWRFSAADVLLSPLLSIVRAVPVASFIILALVWLERDLVPAFIAFLMVLPIITGNVRAGLLCVNPELREVAWLYRFNLRKRIRYLYYPAALPHFLSGAQTSLGLAWKAGVAAEVLCSLSASIGGNIYESKLYLETEALFAWTFTVILISMLIEKSLFRLPHLRRGRKKTEDGV